MTFGTDDVTVSFGEVTALDAITVELTAGEITAVVGADGEGKTTLMQVLAGLVDPESGSVSAPGADRLGYLPSGAGSWRNLTVAENGAFVGAAIDSPGNRTGKGSMSAPCRSCGKSGKRSLN